MSEFTKTFNAVSLDAISGVKEAQFPELNAEQKALAAQFETLSGRFATEPEQLVALNDNLRSKTFVAGNVPSTADLHVFAAVYPLASSLKDAAKFRHVLRWADLVQNTLVTVPEKIAVDLDAKVEREIKEKKKPEAKKEEAKKEEAKKDAKKEAPAPEAATGSGPTEEQKKAKAEAQKAKKAAKAKAKAELNAKQAAAAPAAAAPTPALVDFKVGFIQKAIEHPDADSLYVSTIDCGEETPRTVCSGLRKHIKIEDMQERYVVLIANLKPVTMRGIKSQAMVLCASNADTVEFCNPPEGSKPGDKLFFEGFDGTPEKQLNPKKKIWEAVQPLFTTNSNFEITYTEEGKEPKKLVNAKGDLVKNSTLVGAKVN